MNLDFVATVGTLLDLIGRPQRPLVVGLGCLVDVGEIERFGEGIPACRHARQQEGAGGETMEGFESEVSVTHFIVLHNVMIGELGLLGDLKMR